MRFDGLERSVAALTVEVAEVDGVLAQLTDQLRRLDGVVQHFLTATPALALPPPLPPPPM